MFAPSNREHVTDHVKLSRATMGKTREDGGVDGRNEAAAASCRVTADVITRTDVSSTR